MIVFGLLFAFVSGVATTLFVLIIPIKNTPSKNTPSKNKVHFYVARDKNETLWLYLNKPGRASRSFISSYNAVHSGGFESLGLNADDYKDLRWEDEPIEVFLNMED